MRRKNNQVGFGKSFDSYLSIVTKNGLGMLILVAMASTFTSEQTLSQGKFRRSLGTPIFKQGPPGAKSVSFECRGERIYPIDLKAIAAADKDFFDAFDRGENVEPLAQQYNARDFAHEFYRFEFKARCGEEDFPNEPVILCHPKNKAMGEKLADALKPDSLFRQRMQNVDKNNAIVVLSVWPDSFPFFRDLREELQKEGYLINWYPADRPLPLFHPRRSGSGNWVG